MRRLLKPLWIVLALVFVFEAWLWDRLQPVVARLVARIPLPDLKAWIQRQVEPLPPFATLIVFVVPHAVTFATESALLWAFADVWWLVLAVLVMAKVIGVGLAAFLFQATKPKLMQMAWFAWLYDRVMRALAWAHGLADPYIAAVRAWVRGLRALILQEGGGRVWRMIRAIRARARRSA